MSGSDSFGVATLRQAAKRRADQTSIRSTATEIGMSYTGLRGFLNGGKPHPETLRRLVAWYARHRDRSASAVRREDINAALALLTHYIEQAGTPALLRERVDQVMRSLTPYPGGSERQPRR